MSMPSSIGRLGEHGEVGYSQSRHVAVIACVLREQIQKASIVVDLEFVQPVYHSNMP